jgi:hypothetical protein
MTQLRVSSIVVRPKSGAMFVFRSVKNRARRMRRAGFDMDRQTTGFLGDAGLQKRRKFLPQRPGTDSRGRPARGPENKCAPRTEAAAGVPPPLECSVQAHTVFEFAQHCTSYTPAIHNPSAVHSLRGLRASRNWFTQRCQRRLLLRLLVPILSPHRASQPL